jgi:NAD(P)H-dependent FMN reductase
MTKHPSSEQLLKDAAYLEGYGAISPLAVARQRLTEIAAYLHRLAAEQVVPREVVEGLADACEEFNEAVRFGDNPNMLWLIEALHKSDAALLAAAPYRQEMSPNTEPA